MYSEMWLCIGFILVLHWIPIGFALEFDTFSIFPLFIVFCEDFGHGTSTKIRIPPLLVNRFAKIRMLGEATMTGYPTDTIRSPYVGRSGP